MTVRELIDELKKCPPEIDVRITCNYDIGPLSVDHVDQPGEGEEYPYVDIVHWCPRDAGEWEFLSYDEAVCSACGGVINTHFETTKEACLNWDVLHAFCPHCGAKMKKRKLLKKWAAIETSQNRGKKKGAKP